MAPMEWHTRGDYTVGFSRLELRFMIGGTYGYGAGSFLKGFIIVYIGAKYSVIARV